MGRFQAAMPLELRKQLDGLAKQLADQGRLIEAGWIGCRLAWVPVEASDAQVAEMRNAFMAGAQHLFSCIMASLDAGDEPTEADLRRMDLISAELGTFYSEIVGNAGVAGRA